jgi:REP element-mobilizing transposase RayT
MTRTRYKICEQRQPHFLTGTIVGWLPILGRPEAAQIVLDSWRFLQDHKRLEIFGYVIMENHVHLIASAEDLGKEIGDFKSFTARKIIDLLQSRGDRGTLGQLELFRARHKVDREYQFWQEGSQPKVILGDEMMLQKLEYIHNNPLRRGYVDDPTHWRYSSARNYAGLAGLIPVTTDW